MSFQSSSNTSIGKATVRQIEQIIEIADEYRLTDSETSELIDLEATIKRGLQVFREVGEALFTIRDKRLYRASHDTFDAYCRDRWRVSKTQANRLIAAADVARDLTPIGVIPSSESVARQLVSLPTEQRQEVWQMVVDSAPNGKPTAADVDRYVKEIKRTSSVAEAGEVSSSAKLQNHQLINASTSNEWYTPKPIIDAAREVMGHIDLDPASNAYANKVVQARRFFTADDDGLAHDWYGKVWLNPPYGKENGESNQAKWSARLIEEYKSGRVTEAILLVNAVSGNTWFQPLWNYPVCLASKRIHFYNEQVKSSAPTHANAFVYFGSNVEKFTKIFHPIGKIVEGADDSSIDVVLQEQEHDYSESEQTLASIEEIHLEDGRKLFISRSPVIKKFNRTNDMVDWAWWTLNPVTGCWHGCDYCYARDIANRFTNAFPTGFEPTFHPDRLSAPTNTKLPDEAATDIRAKNVFVSSMGDLFGKWVPDEWILRVFEMVINNPQWNFLFLTKFPQRLQEICDKLGGFPDNAWVGTTVDTQARVKVAEKAFGKIKAKIKWLSCEPLLENLTFTSLKMFDWVVIGGQSKSSKTPEFQPQMEWVSNLFLQARNAGCKVYRKENLTVEFPKELPW